MGGEHAKRISALPLSPPHSEGVSELGTEHHFVVDRYLLQPCVGGNCFSLTFPWKRIKGYVRKERGDGA